MTEVKQLEFYRVNDVMKILDIKESTAYAIIQRLNKELKAMGKITVAGRVSKRYFDERVM